jgi:hypothetical protein
MNPIAFFSLILLIMLRIIGLFISLDIYYSTNKNTFRNDIIGWIA